MLAAIVAASCSLADSGASSTGPNSNDRFTPSLTVSIQGAVGGGALDSVSIRVPLRVKLKAYDASGVASVVMRVLADTAVVGHDSTNIATLAQTVDSTLTIPLDSVRAGQVVTVRVSVTDGANNSSAAEARALAFDPSVPKLSFIRPLGTAYPSDAYIFDLAATDTAGIAKLGYRAIAPGFSHGDSTALPVPHSRVDTAMFSFAVPPYLPVGAKIIITPFAENRDGLRSQGAAFNVLVSIPGKDITAPLVFQKVGARIELLDSIEVTARDSAGQIREFGLIATDAAGNVLHRSTEVLTSPTQQLRRRHAFTVPPSLRGTSLFINAWATDIAGHTGYAAFPGATVPVSDPKRAKRDYTTYAFGLTHALPPGVQGGDLVVDSTRTTVYLSNVKANQVLPFTYGTTLDALPPIQVGSQPWGLTIDNSNSLLLVANSGETNISWVSLDSRYEAFRTEIARDVLYDVAYYAQSGGGYRFSVTSQVEYSGRPQYLAQSASGAIYYSSRETSTDRGTLRRLDNYLDARAEPRQIWQYGTPSAGHYVILNADHVSVVQGGNGSADQIRICDHTPGGDPASATCISSNTVEDAVLALTKAPISGNVAAAKDIAMSSLALADTNLVATSGDRRRVIFGEAGAGNKSGRFMAFFDPTGTPTNGAQYNAPINLTKLTFNASDKIFGIAINYDGSRTGLHGTGTFFADSSLRYVGGYPTYYTGAGIAFYPGIGDDNSPASPSRLVFIASDDYSLQIVDAFSHRLRGRIPVRDKLTGPLRTALPSAAELASNPDLAVKLFALSANGLVVIDLRHQDIDDATAIQALRR
jgi:hypothetical protein